MFNPHKEEFFYLEYLNYIQTRTKWTYAKYGNYEVLKFYRDDNEGYGCVYDSIRRLNRGPLNDSVIFITQGPNHNFRAKTMTAQMKTKCVQTLASYETHTQPDVSDIPAYANDEVKLPNPKWVLYTEQQYPIYNMCKRPKTYGIINAERPKYFVVGKDDVVISATNEKYLYNKVQLSNLYDLASGKGYPTLKVKQRIFEYPKCVIKAVLQDSTELHYENLYPESMLLRAVYTDKGAKYEYYPYEETHLAATDLPKNFVIVGKTPHTR